MLFAVAPLDVLMTSNASTDERFSAERTYTVECRAIGSVPPAKITWWKNDQLVDDLPAIVSLCQSSPYQNRSFSYQAMRIFEIDVGGRVLL